MMTDTNDLTEELLTKYLKDNSKQLLDVLKNLDLTLDSDYKLATELTRMLIKDTMAAVVNSVRLENLNCYVRDEREYAMQLGWNEAVDELNIIREKLFEMLTNNKH